MTAFMFTAEGNEPSELKQLRRDLAVPERHAVVRDITLVGALYDSGQGYLYPRDIGWVKTAVECCNAHGLPVSPSFRLTPLNIRHGTDQDFLRHPPPSDLVIVGFLFSPDDDLAAEGLDRAEICSADCTSGYRLSPLHWEPNAWPEAVKKTGAKMVVSVWGKQERDFTLKAFTLPDFEEGARVIVMYRGDTFSMDTRVRAGVPLQRSPIDLLIFWHNCKPPQVVLSF